MIRIPTLSELYTAIIADLETEYGANINPFGKSYLRAQAGVQAAKLKLYYLAIGGLQKNIFVDTADPESTGGTLERFGRVKLGRNPFPAVPGEYTLQVTGSIGGFIKATTTFKSNDDSTSPGLLYILDSDYTLISTTDSITVRALDAGLVSVLAPGDQLTATAPIANVNSAAVVNSVAVQALAAETIEEYRTKTLASFRLEAQGGAATDYRIWSQDAQGVARVYPYAKSGAANELNIFVEATVADSTDGKGTPSQSILDDVEGVVEFNPDTSLDLDERGRRPLGVFDIHFLPVTIKQVDIEIVGFIGITGAIQTQILDALRSAINDIRPFVSAADILADKNDILDTNRIIATILTVRPGAVFTSVIMTIDGTPLSTFTFEQGDIPYLNSVTYS